MDNESEVIVEFGGTEEVPVVDWVRLWKLRIAGTVHESDRYRWYALWCALAGLFASGVTITIISVSLGNIAKDLDSSPNSLSWTLTGPILAVAFSMPLAGKLGDLRGHRTIYLAGLTVFTVMSGLTALAWDPASLTAFRVIGALGGAATGPASLAIVMHHFVGDDRVRAIGWWQLVGAGSPVIGLAIGGPTVDAFGWRWIFVGQFVFAVGGLVAALVVLRDTGEKSTASLDVAGVATLGLGVIAILVTLQRGGSLGWSQPTVILLGAFGIAMLLVFPRIERRAVSPVLPLEFFKTRNFTASITAQFCANFAYMGSFIISPLLVTGHFGFTTGAAAAAMALRPLIFSTASPISGYVAVRTGERRMAILGMGFLILAMLSFSFGADKHSLAFVFVGLAVAGLGMGIASPSLLTVVGNTVDSRQLGTVNAAQAMVAALGSATGIQVFSIIHEARDGIRGFMTAYIVGAVVASAAALSASALRSTQQAG